MGLLNGLFKTLGFEGEKKKEKQQKTDDIKPQLKQKTQVAEYDLKSIKPQPTLYQPTSQIEVQQLVDRFRDGEDVLVDIKNIDIKERTRSLDFFCGAVYALGGKIKQSDDQTFLFCHLENWWNF